MLNGQEVRALLLKGGSETGIHYYMGLATCPEKRRLDQILIESGEYKFKADMHIGTAFHYLRARFDSGLEPDLPMIDDQDDANLTFILQEAWRLFEFSQLYWPLGAYGKIVSVEKEMSMTLPGGLVLTGRIDFELLVERDDVMLSGTGEPLVPGLYLGDHKSHGKMPSNIYAIDAGNPQFTGYHCLNAANGGTPYVGTIVHHIVRHVNLRLVAEGRNGASFVFDVLPPPTDEQIQSLLRFVDAAAKISSVMQFNLAACGYYGGCEHATNGLCTKGGYEKDV